MNAENFATYLRNPSLLHQIPYYELKSLVLQYPYCQNLQLLLFQKNHLEKHKNLEKELEKAALYSTNRTLLYSQVKDFSAENMLEDNFIFDEQVLELKELEPIPIPSDESPTPHSIAQLDHTTPAENPVPISTEAFFSEESFAFSEDEPDQLDGSAETDTELIKADEPIPLTPMHLEFPAPVSDAVDERLSVDQLISEVIELSAVLDFLPESPFDQQQPYALSPAAESHSNEEGSVSDDDEAVTYPVFSTLPQPKKNFKSWVTQFQPPQIRVHVDDLMEAQNKQKRKKKKLKKMPSIALESIVEHDEVVSETLAEILASQGYPHKAIEMYERLKLVFPEKSSFFAAKIENLKNY
ncbi:MAG TPA: hypothetical protein PKA00_11820 [Saprospiraceae bacterium]|nr:hypothetical protein [Saprospiraceae bacterium]HMQ83592.1 hypothetical protein [Saprospiraceae bacterium]